MSHRGGYASTTPASHKFFKARRYFVCKVGKNHLKKLVRVRTLAKAESSKLEKEFLALLSKTILFRPLTGVRQKCFLVCSKSGQKIPWYIYPPKSAKTGARTTNKN